jgi:hypothetical protein
MARLTDHAVGGGGGVGAIMDIVSVHVEVYAYADSLRVEGEGALHGVDLHVELQIVKLSKQAQASVAL